MDWRRGTHGLPAQRGSALLILLLIILLTTTYTVVNRLSSASVDTERQTTTSTALAQAKDALISFALTYRESHPNQAFGFLPCPDADNDGIPDSCGATDVSLVGRLPWQTLGLPPLRDGDGECVWYAVSGSAKDIPKTAVFNWDTPGQLIIQDASGTSTLAGGSAHDRPFAVILAARRTLGSQTRPSVGAPTECGGSVTSTNYLEATAISGVASASSIVKLSTVDSTHNGSNNDQGLWISGKDIFDRVKRRTAFKNDIDALMNDLANYLNNLAPASLPVASPGNKGVDTALAGYLAANPALAEQKANVLSNWRDNLLYVGGPAGSFSVNSSPTTCKALLFFSGERTTRTVPPLTAQTRSTPAEKGDLSTLGDAGMYLEGSNATLFPGNGAYAGATEYNAATASADFVRCINGLPAGAASFSNPVDFASFTAAGVAVTTDQTTTPSVPSVSIADNAAGLSGGCFWFANPIPIPLAGKTLRAYYEFQLFYADTFALTGSGSDRGNGFTFEMLRSDYGPPTSCGTESALGTLDLADFRGSPSFIVETDIRKTPASTDPAENHTAIMTNANLVHVPGTVTAACDGSASGCRHSPANKFEESPNPLPHNQRIEIHTGCTPGCSSCNPASHATPNTYARISVWVDCTDCNDVVADLNRTLKPPTVQRCTPLNATMDSIYFGFTGGFRSGASAGEAPAQGVTIRNFSLRSD